MEKYEGLNKSQVLNLSSDELLKYTNYMLANGYTLAKLYKDKGIRRQTIRDRLKKAGYKYDEVSRQYVKLEEFDEKDVSIIKGDSKTVETVTEEPSQIAQESHSDNFKTENYIKMLYDMQESIKALNKRLEAIEKNRVNTTQLGEMSNNAKIKQLKIRKFKSEAKIKNYPIYPEVYERITQLKVDNPHLKVKDIVNSLLSDALDRLDH